MQDRSRPAGRCPCVEGASDGLAPTLKENVMYVTLLANLGQYVGRNVVMPVGLVDPRLIVDREPQKAASPLLVGLVEEPYHPIAFSVDGSDQRAPRIICYRPGDHRDLLEL